MFALLDRGRGDAKEERKGMMAIARHALLVTSVPHPHLYEVRFLIYVQLSNFSYLQATQINRRIHRGSYLET